MKFNKLTLALISALMLAGCHDDDPPSPDQSIDPPSDSFIGPTDNLPLGPESAGFSSDHFTLVLQAPDSTLIRRPGRCSRTSTSAMLHLQHGLKEGEYRLMYLEYPIEDNPDLADLADEFSVAQYGLGSRISVKDGAIRLLDSYDENIGLYGSGTEEDPYQITSYSSMIKLAQAVNSEEKNRLITSSTHFQQVGKIDMYQASREIDRRYGWNPIGASSALPFRGKYHGDAISTLIIDREHSAAVGLFGYVHNAIFDGVTITNSAVAGNFAVGALVGASLVGGRDRGIVAFTDCHVSGCEITGSGESVDAGAIIGAVDMQSCALFQGCSSTSNTVSASYNAGGLAGGAGLYSKVVFNSCTNASEVKSDYSGTGGMIGSCDTIYATACTNSGKISGALAYNTADTKNSGIGAGGIVGGAGAATITSSGNTAQVRGYAGVGGLVGSTRIKGSDAEAYMYNNVVARYCYNEGPVSGTDCVGGIVGESQTGTYAVYNTGAISGTRYVAGIAGNTSIAVTHNAVNTGAISGADYVAGIVGKTQYGSIALDHNYGSVSSTGTHTAGVVALAGNNTIIHYCGNFCDITSKGKGPSGGIVGEIGDPRVWTGMNIAECVIGSMEIIMGFVGPVMAVSEHAIEGVSHTLHTFLHITEVLTDSSLLVTDTVFFGMGTEELITEKEFDEYEAEMMEIGSAVNEEIKARIRGIRATSAFTVNHFDKTAISSGYLTQVDDQLYFYESDGGDMTINENINLTREERAEYLEKVHKTNEIIHHVVSGVCVVVGTVAAIGGLVASGGAAAPFVVAGAMASIAGGLNAITKTCLEFEENAVFVTQCLNTGKISGSSGDIGGLVGRLQDNSVMRDCLVTSEGGGHGYPFVGKSGDNTKMDRLLCVGDYDTWGSFGSSLSGHGAVYGPKVSSQDANTIQSRYRVKVLSSNEISKPSTYTGIDSDWKVGTSATDRWVIGSNSSTSFPIPAWSEMRKKHD